MNKNNKNNKNNKKNMDDILNYFNKDGIPIIKNEFFDYILDHVEIQLHGKHKDVYSSSFLISKQDINYVTRFKWYLNKNNYPATYGTKDSCLRFSKPKPLHRLLFPYIEKKMVVDHINRNKLDNRRENLRVCTQKQNSYNTTKNKNSKSKYKGVRKNKKSYTAVISKDKKTYSINNIETEDEAAKIYDMMAEELFGEYAGKNFD
jgi:hypothetical protein